MLNHYCKEILSTMLGSHFNNSQNDSVRCVKCVWGFVLSSGGKRWVYSHDFFILYEAQHVCGERGVFFNWNKYWRKICYWKEKPNHNSVRDCCSAIPWNPKTFIAGCRLFLMTCFDSRAADGTVFLVPIVAFSRNFMLFFTRSKKRNNMANETLGFTDYPMPRPNSRVLDFPFHRGWIGWKL